MRMARMAPVDAHLAVVPVDVRHIATVIAGAHYLPVSLVFHRQLFAKPPALPIRNRNFSGSTPP